MVSFAIELAEFTKQFYKEHPFLVPTNLYYSNPDLNHRLIDLHYDIWHDINKVSPSSVLDIGSGVGFIKQTAPEHIALALSDVIETDEVDYFTETRKHFGIELDYKIKRFIIHRTREWLCTQKKFDVITAIRFLPWNDTRVNFTLQEMAWLFDEIDKNLNEGGLFFYNPVNNGKVEYLLEQIKVKIRKTQFGLVFDKQDINDIVKEIDVYFK